MGSYREKAVKRRDVEDHDFQKKKKLNKTTGVGTDSSHPRVLLDLADFLYVVEVMRKLLTVASCVMFSVATDCGQLQTHSAAGNVTGPDQSRHHGR